MEYKDFNIDFVKRTIAILDDLSNKTDDDLSNKTDYEVTLLINCLFGLIVVPTERQCLLNKEQKKDYRKYFIEQLNRHIPPWQDKVKDNLSVRSMRNALSHLHFQVGSDGGNISMVKFIDIDFYKKNNKKKKNRVPYNKPKADTEIELTVDALREFAHEMATKFLEMISDNNVIDL